MKAGNLNKYRNFIYLLALLLAPGIARAALTIEIIGAGANQIPIAVVPFRAEEGLAGKITPVIAADLARSGLFKSIDAGGMVPVPYEPEQVDYTQWRVRGAEAVVIGSVNRLPDGRYDIRFRLMDVVKQTQLAGFVYLATEAQLRLTAHKIADAIYEKMTGDTGVFATRITYIVKKGTRYELQVADADGYNAQSVLASNEPIISRPGRRMATPRIRVFRTEKPVVYVQSLTTGGRQAVAVSGAATARRHGRPTASAWQSRWPRMAARRST